MHVLTLKVIDNPSKVSPGISTPKTGIDWASFLKISFSPTVVPVSVEARRRSTIWNTTWKNVSKNKTSMWDNRKIDYKSLNKLYGLSLGNPLPKYVKGPRRLQQLRSLKNSIQSWFEEIGPIIK